MSHTPRGPAGQAKTKPLAPPEKAKQGSALLRRHRWLKRLLHDKGALIGGVAVLFMVVTALLAPVLTPHDPMWMEPLNRLKAPSAQHLFGTDSSGRDIFSMVIYGSRISLVVGISVMGISSLAGVIMGLLSGYYRVLDNLIMRFNDGLMAIPSILLAIFLPKTVCISL